MKETYRRYKIEKVNNKNVINKTDCNYKNNKKITSNIDTRSKKGISNQKSKILLKMVNIVTIFCTISGVTGIGV